MLKEIAHLIMRHLILNKRFKTFRKKEGIIFQDELIRS